MELQFLGATGTVSGSKYLVIHGGKKVLVDCGLFQGYKQLRLRNWAPLPVDPRTIHAVVLTHAHIDHSGSLPLLVRNGFRGRIHCTQATQDLCEVLLLDSARLQEEEADYAMIVLLSLLAALRAQHLRGDPLMRGLSFGAIMAITAMLIHSWVDFNLQIPANAMTFMYVLALAWISLNFERRRRGSTAAAS